MGYRSDIAIILTEHAFQKLQDKIAVIHNYDTKTEVYQLLNDAKIMQHEETKDVLIFWSYIKWYDNDSDYKDIAFMDDFLRSLPERDYYFTRIGESIDDNDAFGGYYSDPFDVYIERNIHMDTDNTKQITIG